MYASIIVDISHEKVDRPFQYRIPSQLEGQIEVGNAGEDPIWSRKSSAKRLCHGIEHRSRNTI